ncbi:MAG: bile acid:sodium symporter family protein [Saprospiraceae bacterium]|nr:bile acid:sodium symporter family protein [Saprospiraceae bacterium]
MESLDHIRVNFNAEQLFLLNFCLGFLMFGIAVELTPNDFKALLQNKKSTLVGLMSQIILLPILTILLIVLINPHPAIAAGMLLVAACPGGNVSNYAVHLSRANAPLSVLLTTFSTLAAAFTTPFVFKSGMGTLSSLNDHAVYFSIDFYSMFISIVQLILVPLLLGMLLRYWRPGFTLKIIPGVKRLSLVIFIAFIIFAVAGNLDNIQQHLHRVFFIVLIHNSLALAMGYYFSKIMGSGKQDARTIAIETGIQNSGLALILIFNFFNGNGGMALIAAWWSVWHLVSSFTLALYWKSRPVA